MDKLIRGSNIHKESNKVYYHPDIGLYTVQWEETGNNDIPWIKPISTKCEDNNDE